MSGANSSSSIISLGKMRSATQLFLSPLLVLSRGFFIALMPVGKFIYD
jgi:hypothetical protein